MSVDMKQFDIAVQAVNSYSCVHLRAWWDTLTARSAVEEGFGLFGPSGYILRIGSARFLVDPYLRADQREFLSADAIVSALRDFDGVILSHEHADHYDRYFLRMAAPSGVRFFVPDFFDKEAVLGWCPVPENIVYTSAGMCVPVKDVTLSFFASNHDKGNPKTLVPEYGFAVTHQGKNYVFPVDVRTYDPTFYPKFENVEIVFGHLWLGGGKALEEQFEPMLTDFAAFLASFHPRRITLSHLYETRRVPREMWQYRHAGLVMDTLTGITPETEVTPLQRGIWYHL